MIGISVAVRSPSDINDAVGQSQCRPLQLRLRVERDGATEFLGASGHVESMQSLVKAARWTFRGTNDVQRFRAWINNRRASDSDFRLDDQIRFYIGGRHRRFCRRTAMSVVQ